MKSLKKQTLINLLFLDCVQCALFSVRAAYIFYLLHFYLKVVYRYNLLVTKVSAMTQG